MLWEEYYKPKCDHSWFPRDPVSPDLLCEFYCNVALCLTTLRKVAMDRGVTRVQRLLNVS